MAKKGEGIAALPDFYCQDYIESKELIRLIPGWTSASDHITMLYPASKNTPRRVKEFLEVAKKYFES